MAPRLLPMLLFAAAAALACCAPAEQRMSDDAPDAPVASSDPAPPAPAPPDPEPPAFATPSGLFGQWRVESLSGTELGQSPPIHLLVGHDRIEATSQCVPFAFSIAFHDGSIRVRAESWPGPVCARGLLPSEQAFPRILAAARRLEPRPGGRLAFVGTAGEAVIARPAEPVANPFGNEPAPEPLLLWGEWRLERVGAVPAEAPIRLVFMHHQVDALSGCVVLRWRLEGWGAAVRLERDSNLVSCERSLSADEQALVDILDGEVRVEAPDPRRRRLTGRAGTIVLQR